MRIPRRGPTLLIVLSLFLLGSCGDPTGLGETNIDDSWTGAVATSTLTVTITENHGTITGSGRITGGAAALALNVTGTRAKENVSMTLSSPGYQPMNFEGEIRHKDQITGTISGSGYNALPVTLTRK